MATTKLLSIVLIMTVATATSADRELLQKPGNNKNAKAVPKKSAVKKMQVDMGTCGGAQQIGKSASSNLCCPLCWCVGNQSPNKMFAGATLQKFCKDQCAKCVVEANNCSSPSDPLPKICKQGLQFNAMVTDLVNTCVNMYNKDPESITRAVGC